MKPSKDTNENRRTYVQSMKKNELGLGQIHNGSMMNDRGVCALGYACKLFEVDMSNYPIEQDEHAPSKYDIIGEILGLTGGDGCMNRVDSYEYIWRLNDKYEFSLQQIASFLEDEWELNKK